MWLLPLFFLPASQLPPHKSQAADGNDFQRGQTGCGASIITSDFFGFGAGFWSHGSRMKVKWLQKTIKTLERKSLIIVNLKTQPLGHTRRNERTVLFSKSEKRTAPFQQNSALRDCGAASLVSL
jgi:hypothetical protein